MMDESMADNATCSSITLVFTVTAVLVCAKSHTYRYLAIPYHGIPVYMTSQM